MVVYIAQTNLIPIRGNTRVNINLDNQVLSGRFFVTKVPKGGFRSPDYFQNGRTFLIRVSLNGMAFILNFEIAQLMKVFEPINNDGGHNPKEGMNMITYFRLWPPSLRTAYSDVGECPH